MADEPIGSDHVTKRIGKVPEDIDQLFLPNLESVPPHAESKDPFKDCVHFLNRFPRTEFIWRYSRALLIRVFKSPKLVAWYDYLFYQVRFLGALPRLMRDPKTKDAIPGGYFLGYSNYKSFIRTSTFYNFDFQTHSWKRYLRSPRNMRLGNILHFDMLDAPYFSAKFRQREEGEMEKIFYLRYRLGLVARYANANELKEFFERYIAISDPARIAGLKKRRILLRIDAASDLMKRIAKN